MGIGRQPTAIAVAVPTPTAILLAGAGPPLRASLCARPRQRVDRYLLHSNAVQGIGLRSFGLPFASDPAPWYAVPCAATV